MRVTLIGRPTPTPRGHLTHETKTEHWNGDETFPQAWIFPYNRGTAFRACESGVKCPYVVVEPSEMPSGRAKTKLPGPLWLFGLKHQKDFSFTLTSKMANAPAPTLIPQDDEENRRVKFRSTRDAYHD